ncbi:MAG TPA: APC family permease [Spirochaetia bacterium]|nr:APC family permease [Spirochaetia bacterium]
MARLSELARRARTLIIGGARSVEDPDLFKKLSLVALLAWVGLGADGLTSSCYGPEEAFLALGDRIPLGVFVAAATALTIFVISASYSQIVEAFPGGGGGYVVASKLLSPALGMVSGSALLVDYVLTIALSIAAGTDSLFSSLPQAWQPYKLAVSIAGVLLLLLMNLRGVRESVVPLTPIFLVFLLTHVVAVVYPLVVHLPELQTHAARTTSAVTAGTAGLGTLGVVFLLLRAYSMGAGTFTGIEAVSNAMPILREPRVHTAKLTMRYMAGSLAFMAAGLMVGYILYDLRAEPGRTMNAVLLLRLTQGWGGPGNVFVTVTLLSEAIFLFAAAQTGFLSAPRVLSYMSADRWFPQQFSLLSERFVIKNGIVLTGTAALVTLILTGGSVRFMVVLYSINVFITFSLSQLGMVRHWVKDRGSSPGWRKKILVNGVGLVLTVSILVSMVVLKFGDGGWITLFVTAAIMAVAAVIRRFYRNTQRQLRHLDALVQVVEATRSQDHRAGVHPRAPRYNARARTAVVLVSGFNGMGLHTLFNVVRLFGTGVKNFFFIQAGIIDAERFKGQAEIEGLEAHVRESLDRYVGYVRSQGFFARGYPLVGTDVVDVITQKAREVFQEHPTSIFFGGRIVFQEETVLTRMLYNYVTFAVQRRLHQHGIPFVIVPVPVSADLAGKKPTLAHAETTYVPPTPEPSPPD